MSVIEKAKALKAQADKEKAEKAERATSEATYRKKAYQQTLRVVGKCLAELRKVGFKTKKSWSCGADVFTVSKNKQAVLSIVVQYVWHEAYHDPDGCYSSDAGSSLEIAVVSEEWRGSHDNRGMHGLSTDSFESYVANIIKDHL